MPDGPAASQRPSDIPLDLIIGSCDELERELGAFGFQWLCACAVYPGLRFPLSVYLGRCLAEAVGRPPPNEDEHLALFRLAWFRTGWMPEDRRLVLLQRLDPALRSVVRNAIETLMFSALDDVNRDPAAAPPLDFAPPPRGWRAALSGWLEAGRGAPKHDAIFVHYMLGRVAKPSDLRLHRALYRLFGARLAGWFDRRTLTWGALVLATIAAVWLLADGVIKPLFTQEQIQVVLVLVRGSNVELRDESTGATIAVLSGHTDKVTSAAFSPDGRFLATGSLDDTWRLWDVPTGRAIALRGYEDGVTAIAFSPDGRFLATGSRDGTVDLWEVATVMEIATLRGQKGEVTSVAFSSNGARVEATDASGVVCSWDARSGALISCSAPPASKEKSPPSQPPTSSTPATDIPSSSSDAPPPAAKPSSVDSKAPTLGAPPSRPKVPPSPKAERRKTPAPVAVPKEAPAPVAVPKEAPTPEAAPTEQPTPTFEKGKAPVGSKSSKRRAIPDPKTSEPSPDVGGGGGGGT